jgi:hypothetical protein
VVTVGIGAYLFSSVRGLNVPPLPLPCPTPPIRCREATSFNTAGDLGKRYELPSGICGKVSAANAFYALSVRGPSPRCKNYAGAEAPVAPAKSAPITVGAFLFGIPSGRMDRMDT